MSDFRRKVGGKLVDIDSDSKRIRQKIYQFFINEKFNKILNFFTCILPNYVPNEIIKEFWKNSHFEKMTADFLLRGNIGENQKFHSWKCICLGVFHWSEFWHLRRKPAMIFSNWLFLQKNWVISWGILLVKMQVTK